MRFDLKALVTVIEKDAVLRDLIFRDLTSEFEKKYFLPNQKIHVAVYGKVENCLIFSLEMDSGKYRKVLNADYCYAIKELFTELRKGSKELEFAFNVLNHNARKSFRLPPDQLTEVTCKQLFVAFLKGASPNLTEEQIESACKVFVDARGLNISLPAHLRPPILGSGFFPLAEIRSLEQGVDLDIQDKSLSVVALS